MRKTLSRVGVVLPILWLGACGTPKPRVPSLTPEGANELLHYSAKAEYIRTFGGPGKDRGQLLCPHGLMIDTRPAPEASPPDDEVPL